MKRRPKPLLLTLILLPIIAFAAFYFSRSQGVPSEAEMISNVQKNRAAFQQLVEMAHSDNLLSAGSLHGLKLKKLRTDEFKRVEISQARLKQYQALLKQVGAKRIDYSLSRGTCRFYVFGGGFTDTSWSIGYAWARKPTTAMKIVPSAYSQQGQMRDTTVHSIIEKDWFIFHSR